MERLLLVLVEEIAPDWIETGRELLRTECVRVYACREAYPISEGICSRLTVAAVSGPSQVVTRGRQVKVPLDAVVQPVAHHGFSRLKGQLDQESPKGIGSRWTFVVEDLLRSESVGLDLRSGRTRVGMRRGRRAKVEVGCWIVL